MSALQSLVAALLVLASAVFAAWRLMTPRVRLWVVQRLASAAPRLTARWLARVSSAAASGAASGCQSCSAVAAKAHVLRREG